MAADAMPDTREIYYEFKTIGSAVRVAAIDAETGLEVVIVGPPNAGIAALERAARAKLLAQLARQTRSV
jgi:tRNA U34 5-carboxymethylaminomethyl modifying GTPase MnmE/TrmE